MAERAAIEAAKLEVAVGNWGLVEFGLATGLRGSYGHASMRVPGDPNLFVVKGRGYRIDMLSRLRPEDMVVCDLEGNWVDGPPYSTQCQEVMIHASLYKARPDIVSVSHAHPDYSVLMSVLGQRLLPMAQEGAAAVLDPIPVFPQTKVVTSAAEGAAVAQLLGDKDALFLLGHGTVTVSTVSVEGSVLLMAELEHQARLNYLATCALGVDHPSIPQKLAVAVNQPGRWDEPHHTARSAVIPPGPPVGRGLWNDVRANAYGRW